MSVNSKTATAAIALMIAAGAYPIATMAQTQSGSGGVEVEVIEEGAQTTGEAVEQGASEAGEAVGQAAEETGEAVEQGAEAAAEGAESAGETVVEGAESAGEAVEQGASEAGEAADQATGTTVEVIEQGTDEAAGTAEATGEAAGTAEATGEAAGTAAATGEAAGTTTVTETDVEQATDLDEAQQQELEQAAAEGKPVPPTEMLMGIQQDGQWLSSDLIDQEVRNPEGEVIGDIGAILFSDAGPDGIIVEVGGFLGIGEKDVAIKWSELAISQDGIMVNATEEQLKNAPDFVSLEEQQMEADLEAQQQLTEEDQGMMTSGNTGAVGQEAPATDLQAVPPADPQTGTTQTQ